MRPPGNRVRIGLVIAAVVAAAMVLVAAPRVLRRLRRPGSFVARACPAPPLFSFAPIRPEDLTSIVPLGRVVPPDHVFPTAQLNLFFGVRSSDGSFDPARIPTLPVFSPGAIVLTRVSRKEVGGEVRDYTLDFSVCEGVRGRFMLLTALDPSIARRAGSFDDGDARCGEYPSGGVVFRYCSKEVAIDVAAGERLGSAGSAGRDGRDRGVDLIDFGLVDERTKPIRIAHGTNARVPDLASTVCPLDYYGDSPLRTALFEKLGSPDGRKRRTAPPLCGTIDIDRPGTAAGRWFRSGVPWPPEDQHLALLHDEVDPADGVFSLGTSLAPALPARKLRFTPLPTGLYNRDFAAVSSIGEEVCYDGLRDDRGSPADVVIRLGLVAADRLRVTAIPSVNDCAAAADRPPASLTTVEFER